MKFRRKDDGAYQRRKVTLLGWKGKAGEPEEQAKLVRAEAQSEIPDVFSAVDFSVLEDGSIEGWIALDENFVMAPRFFEAIAKPIEVLVKAWLEPAADAIDKTERLVKQKLTVEIESGFQVSMHEPDKGLLDLREGASEAPFTLKVTAGESKPAANLVVRCRMPEGEQPTLQGRLSEDEGTTDESGLVTFRYELDGVGLPDGEAPGVSFEVIRVGETQEQADVEIGVVSLVAAPRVTLRIEKPGLSEEPEGGAVLEYDPELALGGTLLLKPRAFIKVAGTRFESEGVVRDAKIFVEESEGEEPLVWNEDRLAYELELRSAQGPSPFSEAAPVREGVIGEPTWMSVPIDPGGDGDGPDASGGPLGESLTDVMRASELLVGRFGPMTGPRAVRGFIQALVDRAASEAAETLEAEIPSWAECAARAAESHTGTIDTADAFDRSLTLHKYSYEMFLTNWIGFCVELFFGWFLDSAAYLARRGGSFVTSGASTVGERWAQSRRVAGGDGAVEGLAARLQKRLGNAQDFFTRQLQKATDTASELSRKIDDLRQPRPTPDETVISGRAALEGVNESKRAAKELREVFDRRTKLKELAEEIETKKSARKRGLDDHRELKRQSDKASADVESLQAQAEKSGRDLDEIAEREGPLREQFGEHQQEQGRLAEREADIAAKQSEAQGTIAEGHRERTTTQGKLEDHTKRSKELEFDTAQSDGAPPAELQARQLELDQEAAELQASLESARQKIDQGQAELADSGQLREALQLDQQALDLKRAELRSVLEGIESERGAVNARITELDGAKSAPQAIVDEARPRLDVLSGELETTKLHLQELEASRGRMEGELEGLAAPTEADLAKAGRDVIDAQKKFDNARREGVAAQISEAKFKLEKETLEAARDIIESERDELADLHRRSASGELSAEQAAELFKDLRTRRARSIRARLSQLRDYYIDHFGKDIADLRASVNELFDPHHNVLKDYSAARDQIQALKDLDPTGIEGMIDSLNLPFVSGLHGEAGEDGAKGDIGGDDVAAQFEQKLKELDTEIRNAREGAARHSGGRLVPEDTGWFRWVLDSCAEGVSALLGMAVTGVYWVLVVASLGGVYFLFEGAKIVLSRLMAAIFANIFMAVRYLADKLDGENLKGPQHKHPPEHIARVKTRFANVQSFAGFFLDPRTIRGSKGDLSRVLLIVTAPEVYFRGNKNQDKASLLKRFSGAYNEYYDQQRRTFGLLVSEFATDALDPKGWARKDWPAVQAVTPSLETLLVEAKDYEGDFLAARDGKFTSSGARLLEGGEYSWQDIDQLIDWLVWMFGTAIRLAALVGALLMLVGTMGGSVLIVPGALVLADITEVVAMFIRSTFISLMAHNRVIGIQEDIVVTAALEHDARFGAGTGGTE